MLLPLFVYCVLVSFLLYLSVFVVAVVVNVVVF